MKTSTFSLKLMLTGLCFAILVVAGCSKAGIDNSMVPDPGYGCTTNVVLQTVTNSPGKLVYLTGLGKWCISLDLPNSIYIACETCGNEDAINAITKGHSTADIIDITVSGRIKRLTADQPVPYSHAGYRDIYMISVDAIQQ